MRGRSAGPVSGAGAGKAAAARLHTRALGRGIPLKRLAVRTRSKVLRGVGPTGIGSQNAGLHLQ